MAYAENNDYIDLTKKYLRKYHVFQLTAKALEDDIKIKEQILSASLDVGAAVAKYGDAPTGGNSELSEVEAACDRHLQIEAEVRHMKNDLSALRSRMAKIRTALGVNDDNVRQIVEDYYMNGYSWEQVSCMHNYSPRWCREKANKAVRDMAVVIFGMKACPGQLSLVFAQ